MTGSHFKVTLLATGLFVAGFSGMSFAQGLGKERTPGGVEARPSMPEAASPAPKPSSPAAPLTSPPRPVAPPIVSPATATPPKKKPEEPKAPAKDSSGKSGSSAPPADTGIRARGVKSGDERKPGGVERGPNPQQ